MNMNRLLSAVAWFTGPRFFSFPNELNLFLESVTPYCGSDWNWHRCPHRPSTNAHSSSATDKFGTFAPLPLGLDSENPDILNQHLIIPINIKLRQVALKMNSVRIGSRHSLSKLKRQDLGWFSYVPGDMADMSAAVTRTLN